jgi:hypothetical protein
MRSSLVRAGVFGALLLGGLGLPSCERPDATSTGGPEGSDVATVSFELTLGGKYQFNSLSYDISGNGFHRMATVNVAGSSSFSTLVSGVPVGSGYVAALTAQDSAGKLTPCTGSATFNVTSGASTVAVPVHMSCSLIQATAGSGGSGGSGGAGGVGGSGGSTGAAGTGAAGATGTAGTGGAGGTGGPPPVPVPRSAGLALAALLAALGVSRLRRSPR